jgi:hypothetical protein
MEAQKEVIPQPCTPTSLPPQKGQKFVNSKRQEIHNIFVSTTFIVFLMNKETQNSQDYTHH